ncbi:hypothetical protein OROMI_023152 [Orobanche minor]
MGLIRDQLFKAIRVLLAICSWEVGFEARAINYTNIHHAQSSILDSTAKSMADQILIILSICGSLPIVKFLAGSVGLIF